MYINDCLKPFALKPECLSVICLLSFVASGSLTVACVVLVVSWSVVIPLCVAVVTFVSGERRPLVVLSPGVSSLVVVVWSVFVPLCVAVVTIVSGERRPFVELLSSDVVSSLVEVAWSVVV